MLHALQIQKLVSIN